MGVLFPWHKFGHFTGAQLDSPLEFPSRFCPRARCIDLESDIAYFLGLHDDRLVCIKRIFGEQRDFHAVGAGAQRDFEFAVFIGAKYEFLFVGVFVGGTNENRLTRQRAKSWRSRKLG